MKRLKNLFKKFNIDGYIIPKNDEYFNEYVDSSNDRLKFISNFDDKFIQSLFIPGVRIKTIERIIK